MRRYKILITYDGSGYAGWQVQPGMKTVQGELERCFRTLTGKPAKVHGSGRTDQGVHACGQAAHVDMTAKIPPVKIMQAMNSMLPPDIRLLQIEKVKNTFHARRNAVSKEYRYLIWNKPVMSPFLCRYRAHIRKSLDVKAMRQAARLLTGKHDFAAFTANPQRIVESTVRTLSLLSVRRKGSEISIIARSDGFLYRMVRSLAGFLIRVGQGDLPPATAARILNKKVRTAVVPTAPPQGLFLWKVNYKNS